MIHKIINLLLIPFKVKYIKQTSFVKNWYFKSYYDVYINTGTIRNPSWFNLAANGVSTSFIGIYNRYRLTKRYYKSAKYITYNNIKNYDTTNFHEQLMKESK